MAYDGITLFNACEDALDEWEAAIDERQAAHDAAIEAKRAYRVALTAKMGRTDLAVTAREAWAKGIPSVADLRAEAERMENAAECADSAMYYRMERYRHLKWMLESELRRPERGA